MGKPLQIIVGNTPLLVDFAKLREQKLEVDIVRDNGSMWGDIAEDLLSFLDAFQDAAAKVLGEEEVFGKGKTNAKGITKPA